MSWEKYKKSTTVIRFLSHLRAKDYPHIDLLEQSSRRGVEGYRYVEHKRTDGQWELGDTNTGRSVLPKATTQVVLKEEPSFWQRRQERAEESRELLCVVDV